MPLIAIRSPLADGVARRVAFARTILTATAVWAATGHPLRATLCRVLVLVWLLPCAAILPLGQAEAHAVVVGQSPAADAAMASAPAEVRLLFNEVVTPVLMRVLNANGTTVTADSDVSATDTTVRVKLPADLPPGSYVVTWRVISADSHPVGGSFVFTVGIASAAPAAASVDQRGPWPAIALVERAALYFCFLTAAGGGLFLTLVDSRHAASGPDRRLIYWAGTVAIVLSALSIGVEGTLAAGAPLSGIAEFAVWRIGLNTNLALSAASLMAGLTVMLAALSRGLRVTTVAGVLLALGGFALTGHVATAHPRLLTVPALILHVGAASYWVGALAPLYRRIGAEPASVAAPIVSRFAFGAILLVACLVAAGISIASVQIQTLSALPGTDYGRRFLLKLVCVAALLSFAAFNKLYLTPGFERGESRPAGLLRKSIILEFVLTSFVLLVTASLGQVPPPRAIAEIPHSEARRFTVRENDLIAILAIDPGQRGENRIAVTIVGSNATTPINPLEVTLWFACPGLGIEPSQRTLTKSRNGSFLVDRVPIPAAGLWVIEIDALMTEFDQQAFTVTMLVP